MATETKLLKTKAYYFFSYSPQTVFDPRPFSCSILAREIRENRNRPAIKIAFQGSFNEVEYIVGEENDRYPDQKEKHNNYEHLAQFCFSSTMGKEVKLCDSKLSKALFEPYLDDITYYQIYQHPTIWGDNHQRVEDEHFLPLLTGKSGCVVSYLWYTDKDITLILPQTTRKREMLQTVMQEFVFKYFSAYVPEVEASSWLSLPSYFLPNHASYIDEKEKLTERYNEDIAVVEKKIEENNRRYSFLQDLLTATGDELVDACIKFFKWIGVTNVIDKDKALDKAFNEEDIQIDTADKGLLLVEVKGINGTSTDAQCGQILKNVYRRSKEQQRFDVSGLYIVNNERGVEPLSRTIPPFNHQQIIDAENENRGLCYTWQLFNLFFEIEDSIITKEEARNTLFNKGLLDFHPKLTEVAVPHEYYKHRTIVCLKFENVNISKGDYFFYKENNRWKKAKIITIKDKDEDFVNVSSGSYGFELDQQIPNKKMLYIKQ